MPDFECTPEFALKVEETVLNTRLAHIAGYSHPEIVHLAVCIPVSGPTIYYPRRMVTIVIKARQEQNAVVEILDRDQQIESAAQLVGRVRSAWLN